MNRPALLPDLVRLVAGLMLLCGAMAHADDFHWTGVDRVVAVGDVHGAYDELVSVMQTAGVIDAELNWTGGKTHFVSLGDLVDRGAESRKVIDLLRNLSEQAEEAGGQAHVLMGNHEAMNVSRDLRYADAEELAQYAEFDPLGEGDGRRGHAVAFAADGPYGEWALARPLVIAVNDTLFVHGGMSEAMAGRSLEEINLGGRQALELFLESRNALIQAGQIDSLAGFGEILAATRTILDPPPPEGDAEPEPVPEEAIEAAKRLMQAINGLPFHSDGPLWYRGNAVCHPYYENEAVDKVLDELGLKRIVVAHTTTDGNPHRRLDGRVIRIDTGMNVDHYGGQPTALEIVGSEVRALGPTSPTLVTESNRNWDRPYDMSDAEIEEFLATAEVVLVEEIGTGVTKPKKLTLKKGDRQLFAAFKDYDSDPNLQNRSWGRLANKSDRYVYDMAAYKLDRMLGLELVPPTAIREVDGTEGVVQYWIEGAINEKDKRERGLNYGGHCDLGEQYNLMNVFDALIHNDDRNLTNVMYDGRWKLWLIDHSRAFRSERRIPRLYLEEGMETSPTFDAALEALDKDDLQRELGAYLHPKQITALAARLRRLQDLRK
ncbi:MAG: metallophosphoesterase [Xanthomonadales bacterium]|nr:metallophosphoesterase [Xanthomonadales bacterium]